MKTNPTDAEIVRLFDEQAERHQSLYRLFAGEQGDGIPTFWCNIMEHAHIERFAGASSGDYGRDPVVVYLAAQRALGVTLLDQWIPDNPLTMGAHGYEGKMSTATTGAEKIVVDGFSIEEPEDVCAHMEQVLFPRLQKAAADFDLERRVREIGLQEYAIQQEIGLDILKTGYAFVYFPVLHYNEYGYVNYFCAYALYPELMERAFQLEADLAVLHNRAAALAYERYHLPPLYRLDHDMTDSRGPLVDIRSLEHLWYPQLCRALEPLRGAGVRLIWHCDGNVMPMLPGLIEAGVSGFQGFQYEDGVDYPAVARLRSKRGEPMFLVGGVSVTRTLPFDTPSDVAAQARWLVENRGEAALTLACSSSVAPGVRWENMKALAEVFGYYRTHIK